MASVFLDTLGGQPPVSELRVGLEKIVTEADVKDLFRIILKREATDSDAQWVANRKLTISEVLRSLRSSPELQSNIFGHYGLSVPSINRIPDHTYRVPSDLAVELTRPRNILLVGLCLLNGWADTIAHRYPATAVERILINNGVGPPDMTSEEARKYDFQLRMMLTDPMLLVSSCPLV